MQLSTPRLFPVSLLALAVFAQTPPPGLCDSPAFNKTWRVTAHNAFWQGPWGN